jgi:hypothetical protein
LIPFNTVITKQGDVKMKPEERKLSNMSVLELVDAIEKRSKEDLKDLARIAKGRVHTLSTKKKLTASGPQL